MQIYHLIVITVVSVVASVLGTVVGYGTTMLLFPFLIGVVGPTRAVPLISAAVLLAAFARTTVLWKHIDWTFAGRYLAAAIPCTTFTAMAFARSPSSIVVGAVGLLAVVGVLGRRQLERSGIKLTNRGVWWLGGVVGATSGFGAIVGPAEAPLWVSYGLRGEAYAGTMAVTALATQFFKTVVFARSGVFDPRDVTTAVGLGVLMLLGVVLGKSLLKTLDGSSFGVIVDVTSIAGGLWLLCSSFIA